MAIIDNDCLVQSDVAILLEGDGYHRINKAAELYKTGIVKKVVFSGNIVDKKYGSYPFEELKSTILGAGVSEEDMIHEDVSMNTLEQAQQIVKMASENGWKRLVLVASAEHQYRAYLTFLKEILNKESDILLFNQPARNLSWFIDDGWGDRFHRLDAEFDRIERYTALGHLATVEDVVKYQRWKEIKVNEISRL
ncbi:MAG: YdcF family protein [Lachnospiraceae bacterium]|nr:YdcF family protein [Lachnospiraceae bacterium]